MYNEEKLQTIENKLVAQFSNIFLRAYQSDQKLIFQPRIVKQLEKINQELLTLAKKDAIHYIGTQYYDNTVFAAEDKEAEYLTELMIAYFLIVNADIKRTVIDYSVKNNVTIFEAFNAIGNTKLTGYIRTMSNDVYNQLLLKIYDMAGISYFRFVAVIDFRTSDICRWMNGKIFNVNNVEQFRPPLHPHCRSRLVPEKRENVTRKNKFYAMPKKLTKTFNWFKSTYSLDIDELAISLSNINSNI